MAQTAELDVAPDTVEATLNYIVDDGNKVFTIVAAPGGSDTAPAARPIRVVCSSITAARTRRTSRWSATASVSCVTTPRSPISTTRMRSSAFTTRRWWT